VAGNARPARAEGKCHREQTACTSVPVRVKGWGKSPPRAWRQDRHGKPHPEQDQIGGADGPSSARTPGRSREASSNGRPRGMIAAAVDLERQPSQNPAYRPSGWVVSLLLQVACAHPPPDCGRAGRARIAHHPSPASGTVPRLPPCHRRSHRSKRCAFRACSCMAVCSRGTISSSFPTASRGPPAPGPGPASGSSNPG